MLPLILAVLIISIGAYFWCTKINNKKLQPEPEQIKRKRQLLRDNQCCICLSEQKQLQLSSSCAHSFCGLCLIGLHQHSKQQLKCPLCREDINVIFKCFHNKEPKEQINKLTQKIIEYNRKYGDDNRSFIRKVKQFPYVLKIIGTNLLNLQFIRFFFTTANIAKIVFTMLIYILSPIDLIPELLVGVVGFIDDIFFVIIAILFSIANSGIQYMRRA